MIKITKGRIHFCYGHRLLNYNGPCAKLHGHNANAEFTFYRKSNMLDEKGMVVDFSDIKKPIKKWIDDHFDHGMLVNKDDTSLIDFLKKDKQKYYIIDEGAFLGASYSCNPTAENICRILFSLSKAVATDIGGGLICGKVKVSETDSGWCEITDEEYRNN